VKMMCLLGVCVCWKNPLISYFFPPWFVLCQVGYISFFFFFFFFFFFSFVSLCSMLGILESSRDRNSRN
jgi:hypothetical protein